MSEYASRVWEDYTTSSYEGPKFRRYWCCTKYSRNNRGAEYEPVTARETERESESLFNGKTITTTVTAAGAAYLTYRAIRLIPSLIPFFWGTLPLNLSIP